MAHLRQELQSALGDLRREISDVKTVLKATAVAQGFAQLSRCHCCHFRSERQRGPPRAGLAGLQQEVAEVVAVVGGEEEVRRREQAELLEGVVHA